MTILLTGGGTGGHITPLLAVGHELKSLNPEVKLVYVGEKGGKFQHLTQDNPLFDDRRYIYAGKFRRYAGESWWRRLTDLKTLLLNLRDVFYVAVGFFQALRLLGKVKPDIIFVKGGFVGLPVGLAAAVRRVPFITHDSDSTPGLTNRVIGRWAKLNTTAWPASFYSYRPDRLRQVGVPLAKEYQAVDTDARKAFRRELDIPLDAPLLVITGGSQGAANMNRLLAPVVEQLLQQRPSLRVIHQVGKSSEGLYSSVGTEVGQRLQTPEFLTNLYRYTGAADLVICRASATTIAELAEQGRPCIVIPGALAGDHQQKNARYLADQQAVMMFTEKQLASQPQLLSTAVSSLLDDPVAGQRLADQLRQTAKPGASQALAGLLLNQVQGEGHARP